VKIEGSHALSAPPDRVYNLLQDPGVLTRCIPGCESLEKIGPDEYEMKMKMVLAAVSGSFAGKVKLTDHHPPTSFRLNVEGSGKIGWVKGGGVLTLSEATTVHYEGEVQIGGTIAAVGQRLVDTTAKMLIKRFFDKFAKEAAPSADALQ
jgi:carbon monoxide dehydrogenase subunit G